MASNNVLKWPDGRGWIVLSGGVAVESEIRARVLGRATAEGGVAYISVKTPEGSEALNDMDDLGAPTGYMVDVLTEDDETIFTRLSESSIVVLEDTGTPDLLLSGLVGAAADGIKAALVNGAIVLAEGASAAALGKWLALDSEKIVLGLEWIENTLIVPGSASLSDSPPLRSVLRDYPDAIAIGIGLGSALVLGPNGEIETWGTQQVTISLGPGHQRAGQTQSGNHAQSE